MSDYPTWGQRKSWNNDGMDPDWKPKESSIIGNSTSETSKLKQKLEIAVKALKDIESEEINSQRPGGGYSRSAIISFKAIKEIEGLK